MPLHPRRVLRLLRARLASRTITVLTGARQTGKTTLVRDLLPAAGAGPSVYFSLDDPDERLRLVADPVRRLDHGPRLVLSPAQVGADPPPAAGPGNARGARIACGVIAT